MKYSIEERRIWLNGQIVNVNDAKINVLSPTSQFGLNVFEGIPCYWNEDKQQLYAFRLDDHYKRLQKSAALLEIECPYSMEEMKKAFIDVIRENDYKEDLSVRQTLFVEGFGSWGSSDPVGMFVAPIPKRKTSSEYNKKGLNVCISTFERISEKNISPIIKCGANYINSRNGQREALKKGFDTCLFLNNKGTISEGPGSCFFMVKDKTLITPTLFDSVLNSITRDTIIKIAKSFNLNVIEKSINKEEVFDCDEAFLCGSAMEITPILKIDNKIIGEEAGLLTTKIHEEYLNIAKGNKQPINGITITEIYSE